MRQHCTPEMGRSTLLGAVIAVAPIHLHRLGQKLSLQNPDLDRRSTHLGNHVKGIEERALFIVEERLTAIQHEVMSRALLGQVLDEYKRFKRQVTWEGIESALDILRHRFKFNSELGSLKMAFDPYVAMFDLRAVWN